MIVIVIPTYKEKDTLKRTLPILNKLLTKKDVVLLIDDTKNFETKQFNRGIVKVFPRIGKKRGYGRSLKQGLMIATYVLDADYIIQMDADHDPKDVKEMLKHNSDFLIGYDESQTKLRRKLVSGVAGTLCRRLLGLKVKHPSCGFRMFKNEVLRNIEWRKIKSKGFGIQIEILYHITRMKYKIKEVSITHSKRKYERSKMGLRQCIGWLLTLFRLLRKHLYMTIKQVVMGIKS